MDLSEVLRAPGVVGVYTHKDVPGMNDIGPIIADDPMLVDETTQHVGHALFSGCCEKPHAGARGSPAGADHLRRAARHSDHVDEAMAASHS